MMKTGVRVTLATFGLGVVVGSGLWAWPSSEKIDENVYGVAAKYPLGEAGGGVLAGLGLIAAGAIGGRSMSKEEKAKDKARGGVIGIGL